MRIVTGAKAVQKLMSQVKDSHPQGDPLGVPGLEGDEEAVEVVHLRSVRRPNIDAVLADAASLLSVTFPGEAEDFACKHLAGEEDGEAVLVKLIFGEGSKIFLRGVKVSRQEVVIRLRGREDTHTRDMDPDTVRVAVSVIVLVSEQEVGLPDVVQHLEHGLLD